MGEQRRQALLPLHLLELRQPVAAAEVELLQVAQPPEPGRQRLQRRPAGRWPAAQAEVELLLNLRWCSLRVICFCPDAGFWPYPDCRILVRRVPSDKMSGTL